MRTDKGYGPPPSQDPETVPGVDLHEDITRKYRKFHTRYTTILPPVHSFVQRKKALYTAFLQVFVNAFFVSGQSPYCVPMESRLCHLDCQPIILTALVNLGQGFTILTEVSGSVGVGFRGPTNNRLSVPTASM